MFPLWLLVVSVFHCCSGDTSPLHAYSPGDIVIGGLFPIHYKTNRSTILGPLSCSDYNLQMFLRTQVMIHAIREVNQRSPRVLPNFTVGYNIYDTCGDSGLAIRATLQLLKNPESCLLPADARSALAEPQTKAVIGAGSSGVSKAVAGIVALSSVAQIGYASTSELLSSKFLFPTFLRMVPSDQHQTVAIVELVKMFNWQAVAIVGSDDEYGKYGSDSLDKVFRTKNVCIEFIHILSGKFLQENQREAVTEVLEKITNCSAEAIILFTKQSTVKIIMEAAINAKLNRTWIASDTWSNSPVISALSGIEQVGPVFGFIFKGNEVPGFKDYVMSMFDGTTNAILEYHLSRYPLCSNQTEDERRNNCSLTGSQRGSEQCLDPSCLAAYVDQDISYSIYLAVQVIAEGLRRVLKCNNQQCERRSEFTAAELLREIQKVNFTVNTTHIFFNADGDPSLGYDILYWNKSADKDKIQIEMIGHYLPDGKIKISDHLYESLKVVTFRDSNCSTTCNAGEEPQFQNQKCCAVCVPCARDEFSPGNGVPCKRCSEWQYSLDEERDRCWNKTDQFLPWLDPFSIILSCLAASGILLTIAFAILFMIYRKTPVVKAVGGWLSFLELFSLLAGFCLTFSFLGKPTNKLSCVGFPVFGISFSICISCILANLLQILVGFEFDLSVRSWVKKLNRPLALVTIASGVQLAISVPWLILNPPVPVKKIDSSEITLLHQCEMKSSEFFIAMIAYNAFLGFICFLFAFKGKRLPDLYKNAALVTISMLLFLILWSFLIPLSLNLKGKYKPAVQSVAILISNYSILGCHLAPKCYIMVFRKQINNERAITEYIRKHYEQKGIAVVQS